jgi:two-component system, OmpR family, sensor histidine kinase KdpD
MTDTGTKPSGTRRGELRIYLGAAAGVGKTFAMLGEGHRRQSRGADVVVAFVETHGRRRTAEQLAGLEVMPRARIAYRGSVFEEMDVDGIIARHPQIALVDELAHTNVPGSRNEKRWQDVDELLKAGIDVITTVNIQHLESLNDVVQKITGVPQRETIPDAVARAADQVELVDMTPEALRRRMAHGNVYPAEKIDAALNNYFRAGNLTALRELALLWLADKVDEGLKRYREAHDITGTWEARERVVVALTGGPEGEQLIRRAARIAARSISGAGDLLAVYVTRSDGLTGADPSALAAQRRLAESLGGSYHQVVGDDVSTALLDFARAENATQLVLGASRRNWINTLLTGPGVSWRTIRDSGDIDVHIVTHSQMGRGRGLPTRRGGLSLPRRLAGYLLAVVLAPLLTLALANLRPDLTLTSDVLVFLIGVVAVALVGGLLPAVLAVVAGSLLLNYYFTPPLYTFNISDPNNAFALLVFLVVAAVVATIVDNAARRSKQAVRASAESDLLVTTAGSILRGAQPLQAVIDRVREAFGMQTVTMLERDTDGDGEPLPGAPWHVVAASGEVATEQPPVTSPEDADVAMPIDDKLVLAARGRTLPAQDRRVLGAFAAYAAAALEQQRLTVAAQAARPIAEADRMRTALLAAVSHDLRTPLASAKAAVTSLRSDDVQWNPQDYAELLATADESLDKLARLVENLLDVSRLQAGAMSVFPRPADLGEVVARSLDDLGPGSKAVVIEIPANLPEVHVDPGILERVLANLVANALRYSPAGSPPVLTASSLGDRVEVRVIDRGPGIAEEQLRRMFVPFQRLGDTDNTTGIGLGLALSKGLTEAMSGTLEPQETPGGGLTMTLSVPAVTVTGLQLPAPSPFPAPDGPVIPT